MDSGSKMQDGAEPLSIISQDSGPVKNEGEDELLEDAMGNTVGSTIGLSAVAGSTGSAMQRSTTRSISSGATFSEHDFVNSERYWKKFEDSKLYQNLMMVSAEGVDLAETRKTSRPVQRSPAPAYRSPTRKLKQRIHSNSDTADRPITTVPKSPMTEKHTSTPTVVTENNIKDGSGKPIGLEDSIFDFIDPDQEEPVISKMSETNERYSELGVLAECQFTDASCHYSSTNPTRSVKFESDVEPRIYWVREDRGTLGYINIGDDVRVVLLRGLKKPKNIEVVGNRVYWLEEGNAWQYNGRISFLNTKTMEVHTLLSSLSEPRGLHVTSHHHVFFLETNRDFYRESGDNSNINTIDGTSSIVNIDLNEPSSLLESLASSRQSKLNSESMSSQHSKVHQVKNNQKWSRVWKVRMLNGNLIDLSVPGANLHLAGLHREICKIPPTRDLWEQMNDFASEVDGMPLMTKGVGHAEPCDVAVVFSDSYEKPKVIIGVDLYEMRTVKVKEKDQNRLDFLKTQKTSPSSKTRGRRSTMPNIRQNFSVRKKLKFKLDPVVEKVQVGGGLLYCDVLGLHKAKESKADEDDRYFSDLQILCTLPSAAHRLYTVPTHYSKKQANIFDLVLSCKFDAPSIYPLPGVEDALEIPGFGLAHLAIPKRFEITIDEMTSFLTPLSSRGLKSFAPVETRKRNSSDSDLLTCPIMALPTVGSGIYAFVHNSIKTARALPRGWLVPGKDVRKFSRYLPDERRKIRDDELRAKELMELNKLEFSDSDSESGQLMATGRERSNSMALSIMSTVGSMSAFGGATTTGRAMNVKVILRCRPLFEAEARSGVKDVVVCTRRDCTITPLREEQSKQTFKFERVFNRNSNQMEIFEESVRPSVLAALDGYNVTVFAYGQTGTGKTYTMEGKMERSDLSGIIPRSVYTIFEILMSTTSSADWNVSVSHLEIYQEQLTDLLAPDELRNTLSARLATENITTSQALVDAAAKRGVIIKLDKSKHGKARKRLVDASSRMPLKSDGEQEYLERLERVAYEQSHKLRIRKTDDKGMEVMNLTTVPVKSPDEIFEILEHSIKKRATAETLCNKFSSRSHAIFSINLSIHERDENGERTGILRTGRLNLVDLSGSENVGRSGSVGTRFKEARNINQGLLALGRVIKARTEGATHVPYRDSKLTQLLQESLGGNSVTTLILTISPNHREMAETLSTLNYAHQAKVIENRPSKNLKRTGEKGGKGKTGAKGRIGGNDDDLVPLIAEGEDFTLKSAPWIGRVPIRAPSSRSRKRTVKGATPRLYHAPSADWFRCSVLKPESMRSSKSATNLGGVSFASHKYSKNEEDIVNFGYSPFKPPPSTPTLSARENGLGVSEPNMDLNFQAMSVLKKLFGDFDLNALKSLERQLMKARGRGPKLGIRALDEQRTASTRVGVMGREVYTGTQKGISKKRRPSTSSSTRSRSGANSMSSNRGGNLLLPSPSLNLDFDGFLALFVACAKADPTNALKTIGILGYRRNFSKIPVVKNQFGKETQVKEHDARDEALPSLAVLRAAKGFKKLIKPKTALEKLKQRQLQRKGVKVSTKRATKPVDPRDELINVGETPTPSQVLWRWLVFQHGGKAPGSGTRRSRRVRPSTAH